MGHVESTLLTRCTIGRGGNSRITTVTVTVTAAVVCGVCGGG